jgi:hypothetical protein
LTFDVFYFGYILIFPIDLRRIEIFDNFHFFSVEIKFSESIKEYHFLDWRGRSLSSKILCVLLFLEKNQTKLGSNKLLS